MNIDENYKKIDELATTRRALEAELTDLEARIKKLEESYYADDACR